eukprot:4404734-Prymnesium_polylepis.1
MVQQEFLQSVVYCESHLKLHGCSIHVGVKCLLWRKEDTIQSQCAKQVDTGVQFIPAQTKLVSQHTTTL